MASLLFGKVLILCDYDVSTRYIGMINEKLYLLKSIFIKIQRSNESLKFLNNQSTKWFTI